jgi:peptidylprolyl isomerase
VSVRVCPEQSSRDRPGFFEFDVGVGRVIKGWDVGICSMHKGEKCVLACRSDYAYGESGSPPKIPPGATLLFEVELFGWKEQRKDKDAMSTSEQLAAAEAAKEKGTSLFKLGKWEAALGKYEDASYYVGAGANFSDDADAEAAKQTLALHVSCCLNGATCALKLASYGKAVELCDMALAADADAVAGVQLKAFFRRGTAYMHLGEYTNAKADLRHASTLDPKSKEVRDTYAECAAKAKGAKQSEKALYGKMFG